MSKIYESGRFIIQLDELDAAIVREVGNDPGIRFWHLYKKFGVERGIRPSTLRYRISRLGEIGFIRPEHESPRKYRLYPTASTITVV